MSSRTSISAVVVFALAINLRPAVTSLGAALQDVSVARNLVAAALVAVPLWAIGMGGWVTPRLHERPVAQQIWRRTQVEVVASRMVARPGNAAALTVHLGL